MESINFGGIIKSWREPPRQNDPKEKSPWLEKLWNHHSNKSGDEGRSDKTIHPHIFNISFRPGCRWNYQINDRGGHWHYFVGYSNGELVMATGATLLSDCYVLNPIDKSECPFPPWDTNVPFEYVVLPSSRHIRHCTLMVFIGISHPAFVFCKVGNWNGSWTRQDYTHIEPYASKKSPRQHLFMQFTNAVGFNGKVYTLSLQGSLVVIEGFDSHPRITTLGTTRAIPSVSSKHFREYLIESDGDFLLVFLISMKSVNVVDDAEVFRLNILDKLSWVKMESFGDRTLFVGVN